MKLRDLGILADENIHPVVVNDLRARGFNVVDVHESSSLIGAADIALIRLALSQNRVILTHDRDFGRLAVASLEPMVGIVFL